MRKRRPPRSHALFAKVSALAALSLVSCDPREPPSAADAGSPPSPASATASGPRPALDAPPASARPTSAASALSPDNPGSLQILRFTFTSNVREKEPVDKLSAAKPSQRVWAHIDARNRSGFTREIDLVFRVNGKERSRVPLEVQSSWSFRTFGYVTLRPADTSGEVSASIIGDDGEEIMSAKLPIRP